MDDVLRLGVIDNLIREIEVDLRNLTGPEIPFYQSEFEKREDLFEEAAKIRRRLRGLGLYWLPPK